MSEATALTKTETANGMESVSRAVDNEVAIEQQRFDFEQRKAAIYAKSSLVPKEYQNNIGNVLIAVNMAKRMGADPLMVMQNLYVVHGRPGWSAVFLISCFNTCGRFSAIKYRFEGEPNSDDYGCVAYCTETATGDVIEGTKITWGMAKKEGWATKNLSKWMSMPEQMFRYRAATFLIRSTAPEIGMGLLTRDELDDISPNSESPAAKSGIAGLKTRMNVIDETIPEDPSTVEGEIVTEEPVTDEETPDVTTADAQDAEPEPSIDKEESTLEDLRAAAMETYRGLTHERKQEAAKWLGVRELKNLKSDELESFLDTFR